VVVGNRPWLQCAQRRHCRHRSEKLSAIHEESPQK
jgi:hypothetical protein